MEMSPGILLGVIGGMSIALLFIVKNMQTGAGTQHAAGADFEAKLKPGEVVVEPEFDADAALANYLRKREAGLLDDVSITAADDPMAQSTPHPANFGRKAI